MIQVTFAGLYLSLYFLRLLDSAVCFCRYGRLLVRNLADLPDVKALSRYLKLRMRIFILESHGGVQ